MFDIETSATIRGVTVRARTKDGVTTRRCRIQLDREFDEAIARCIGPEASAAFEGVRAGAIEKLTFPIDAVLAQVTLNAHEGAQECLIGRAIGVKAVAAAPGDEDAEPSVRLEFEFPFTAEVWLFLGQNVGADATISVRPAQETLKFPRKAS